MKSNLPSTSTATEKGLKVPALSGPGFVVHFVIPDIAGRPVCDPANFVSYHTHDLPENYGHPNLEIVFPLNITQAAEIFQVITYEICTKGYKFRPGLHTNVLQGLPIKIMADEAECEAYFGVILRVILPDKHGKFGDEAEPEFAEQEKVKVLIHGSSDETDND